MAQANAYLDGGEGIDTFRVGLQKMDWPKTDDPNNLVNLVYKVNLAEEYGVMTLGQF